MANFTWTNAAGGDWSNAANWSLGGVTPALRPPGAGDTASFDNLASSYTVTIPAGLTVGNGTFGPTIEFAPTALIGSPTLFIGGSLTANFIYFTSSGDPATSVTVEDGGSLFVPQLLYSINVLQTLTISGTGAGGRLELGDLTVGAFVSGTSSLMTLDFANASVTAPNTGVIQFDNANLVGAIAQQTITNVAWGNEFIIQGADFADDTVSYVGNVLRVVDAGVADPGSTLGATLFLMTDVSAVADTTFAIVGPDTIEAVCYARGTMIRTPDGELPVEKLRSGKRITTLADGQEVTRTVRWLGHRRIDLIRHPRPETVTPIRIERDAFADNVPHRDLLVSPDHAIFVDGKLICAKQLVNGTTIRGEKGWSSVDYYHVELNDHAILLAEGLPAESYLDTGNRGFFANAGAPLVLHPDLTDETDYPTREAASCAPFVWDEASVWPVWQRLADRAAAIGGAGPQRVTTTDADPRLVAGQRTVKPVISDSERILFMLPCGATEVRLVSRAQSPTEARPWLSDQRRLGVRVKRIVLRDADETREIPMDHPAITRGWWDIERDGPIMSRWTNGDAVLPLPPMRGPAMLEIHLAGAMTYVVDAVPEDVIERCAA